VYRGHFSFCTQPFIPTGAILTAETQPQEFDMFGKSTSDRGPINDGSLTFATQLTDSFGPSAPRHRAKARVVWGPGWLQQFVAWWTRPLAGGTNSATDAATRLQIKALGGLRH
jgi:hypothetical protein